MLSVAMLTVVILNVIILSVVAPNSALCGFVSVVKAPIMIVNQNHIISANFAKFENFAANLAKISNSKNSTLFNFNSQKQKKTKKMGKTWMQKGRSLLDIYLSVCL